MVIFTDYIFRFRKGIWFSNVPWNKDFHNLYKDIIEKNKITIVGFIDSQDDTHNLLEVDQRYYNVIALKNYKNNPMFLLKDILIIKSVCHRESIIFLKLFYINSIIAYIFVKKKRQLLISQLVGDSEIAFMKRKDIYKYIIIGKLISKLIYSANHYILKRSTIPVCVSNSLKRKYIPQKQCIISNESWLKESMFFKAEKIFSRNSLKVLFVGRLIPLKGLQDLLSTIQTLIRKKIKIELGIIGDGLEYKNLVNFCNTKKIDQYVKFYGWVPALSNELFEIYRQYDVFCLPSYSEGLPLVILEAMANKLIIVSTNVGGIPELIKDKENGFLYNPGDISKLEQILIFILKNIDSKQFHEMINKNYSISIKNSFYNSRSQIPKRIKEISSQ